MDIFSQLGYGEAVKFNALQRLKDSVLNSIGHTPESAKHDKVLALTYCVLNPKYFELNFLLSSVNLVVFQKRW